MGNYTSRMESLAVLSILENIWNIGNFLQMGDPPFGNPLLKKIGFILHFLPLLLVIGAYDYPRAPTF